MKWKSDLFNNIVRMGIYLLLWGVSSDMVAQEDVKRIVRDSVRTSSEIQEGNSFSVSFLHLYSSWNLCNGFYYNGNEAR